MLLTRNGIAESKLDFTEFLITILTTRKICLKVVTVFLAEELEFFLCKPLNLIIFSYLF